MVWESWEVRGFGGPKVADDGGRETDWDVLDVFFFRPNQPFFSFSSPCLTTTRSPSKSGSCNVRQNISSYTGEITPRSDAYLRFVKVVCRDREAELIKDERHECPVAHVSRDFVRHVNILEVRDILNWAQPCNSIQAAARGAEQVVEHPVVPRVAVHETPRYGGADLEPGTQRGSHGCAKQDHVLYDAIHPLLRELDECVEDDSSAERETNEGNGAYPEVSVYEYVREDAAR